MPSTADDFRVRVEMRLPSGLVALIRPVDVDFFVRVGRVPSMLAGTINQALDGTLTVKELADKKVPDEATRDNREWITFLNQLTVCTFVPPRIVDVPMDDGREVKSPQGEDELSIDDVSYGDKIYIYGLFTLPAQILRRFHQKQVERLASVEAPASNGTEVK